MTMLAIVENEEPQQITGEGSKASKDSTTTVVVIVMLIITVSYN